MRAVRQVADWVAGEKRKTEENEAKSKEAKSKEGKANDEAMIKRLLKLGGSSS